MYYINIYGRNMKETTTVIQQRIIYILSKIYVCIQRQKMLYTWKNNFGM